MVRTLPSLAVGSSPSLPFPLPSLLLLTVLLVLLPFLIRVHSLVQPLTHIFDLTVRYLQESDSVHGQVGRVQRVHMELEWVQYQDARHA